MMIRRQFFLIFIVSLLFTNVLSADSLQKSFKDLGLYGNLFEITEEDEFYRMKREFKKISHEKIIEAANTSAKELFNVKTDISNCLVNTDKVFDPTVVLEKPIDLSKFGIYINEGTKFNPLEKGFISSYIIFIDANDFLQVKLVEKLYGSIGKNLMIIVSNGEMTKLNYLTTEIYKLDQPTINAFHLQCVPSIYIQQENHFFVREFALRKQNSSMTE